MQRILLLFVLFLTALSTTHAQVYVDASATGTGDGSSWDNAYPNLADALAAADSASAVWIAAGTYTTPADSSFFIGTELALYGGFAGDEANLEDADPAANVTILSGDVLGNDDNDMGYDSLLAVDNNRVLFITDTAAVSRYTVTLNGLTIQNGAIAPDRPSGSSIPFSGGGILSFARLDVSNVTFLRNRANFGSATALFFPTANQSRFDNVNSEGNYFSVASIHYSNSVDSIYYTNLDYTGSADTVSSAFIDAAFGDGLFVDNCSFDNVYTGNTAFGGTITTFNVSGVRITNSDFGNSFADVAGGALGLSFGEGNDTTRNLAASDAVIDSCTFTNVTSGIQGGAVYLQNISVTVSNSTFDEGLSARGGAIYAQSTDGNTLVNNHRLENCEFNDNGSGVNGGALFYSATNTNLSVVGSTFNNSTGGFGGAVLLFGSAADTVTSTLFDNCEFTGNASARTGGAIYIQNEGFVVSDCIFDNNTGQAGTIGMFGSGNDTYSVSNSSFTNNGTGNGNAYFTGAGIYAELTGGSTPDIVNVDSCTFNGNIMTQNGNFTSGGTIFIAGDSDARPMVNITASSFTSNATLEGANGAGIYLQDGVVVDISDSDFSNNNSAGSGGVFFSLQFTEELIDTSSGDTVIITRYPTDNTPELRITRSLFLNNTSGNQGGVADLQVGQVSMTNSLVIGNAVTQGQGSGGAFIINGTDDAPARLENVFVNNTFYNNLDGGRAGVDPLLGAAGNAIALFQNGQTDADSNSVTLTIQNNAFFQADPAEESLGIEQTGDDGNIVINSLGGNFYNSAAQPDFPVTQVGGSVDVTDVDIVDTDIFSDPLLDNIDTEFADLDLIRGDGDNPLIDAGTTGDLVPEVDFFNEARDDMPDIGAIEYNGLRVDVAEPIANSGLQLSFYPNPTADVLNIVNDDATVRSFTVLVSDMQGRTLTGRQFTGVKNELDLTALPGGVYNLSLLINGKAYSQQVVKQ